MNLTDFKAAVQSGAMPDSGLSVILTALFLDGQGNWSDAHDLLQNDESADGAWVHAYLHRKEDDLSNAAYWYRRAGKPTAMGSLSEEWDAIAHELLAKAE